MSEKLLEVKDLKVYFEMKKGFAQSLFGKPLQITLNDRKRGS